LAGIANDIQAAMAPLERLQEITDQPSEVAATRDFPTLARHTESIVFEGVRFRYPDAQTEALRGIDLRIEAGEHVAIVGSNGCGKTTLLSLLPRLLDPTEGRISIDGTDVSKVRLDTLREQIGVVTQETVLIRASIRENIAFGREGDDAAIRAAAGRAHAAGFIDQLSEGYETLVAEMGASLSGGQRQRIAIARALFREPSILMLDEATSQIDSESELQINSAIAEFRTGRTALVIAHRLSTVLAADRIVVMEEGRIVDDGTHEELIERCEAYQSLARTQLVTN
jgi:ABC-type multidrug transport system fused ATPase/permease subunit